MKQVRTRREPLFESVKNYKEGIYGESAKNYKVDVYDESVKNYKLEGEVKSGPAKHNA